VDERKHIIVVGGGIAGLAAAFHIQRFAEAHDLPISLQVLEREPRLGGKIITERVDGFIVEGGPDTFVTTKPWAMALCRELGIEHRLHGTNPDFKRTYILHDARLHPLPGGLTMMIPTEIRPMVTTGLLSWRGKARMAMDFFLPPEAQDRDESIGGFVRRRLGREAYEHLVEPLMSGIYAGDGDELSLRATLPYLRDLEQEHRGLVRGALAMRKARRKNGQSAENSRSLFMTPRTGLAEIVDTLAERLHDSGVELHKGVEVADLLADSEGPQLRLSDGTSLHADAIVLATPAYVAADLLRKLDSNLASELSTIEYASTATITLAYRENDLSRELDGYGYVIPRREGRKVLACTWTSSKFPHRAPEGHALVRVFVGRAGQEAEICWEEPDLLEIAKEELRDTLGIVSRPLFSRVHIFHRAMPQYNLGHPARLERIDHAMEKWPWLALAGAGYRGIGIPDCIHSGELAGERIVAQAFDGSPSPEARLPAQA